MEYKKFIKKLGKNIRDIRVKKKIKQIALAHACDMDAPNLRRIEAGNTNPTIKTLLKISEELGVTIMDLLTFD